MLQCSLQCSHRELAFVSVHCAFDASQEAERMFIDLDAKYEIACMKEIGVDSIGLTLLSVCPTE